MLVDRPILNARNSKKMVMIIMTYWDNFSTQALALDSFKFHQPNRPQTGMKNQS